MLLETDSLLPCPEMLLEFATLLTGTGSLPGSVARQLCSEGPLPPAVTTRPSGLHMSPFPAAKAGHMGGPALNHQPHLPGPPPETKVALAVVFDPGQ